MITYSGLHNHHACQAMTFGLFLPGHNVDGPSTIMPLSTRGRTRTGRAEYKTRYTLLSGKQEYHTYSRLHGSVKHAIHNIDHCSCSRLSHTTFCHYSSSTSKAGKLGRSKCHASRTRKHLVSCYVIVISTRNPCSKGFTSVRSQGGDRRVQRGFSVRCGCRTPQSCCFTSRGLRKC